MVGIIIIGDDVWEFFVDWKYIIIVGWYVILESF